MTNTVLPWVILDFLMMKAVLISYLNTVFIKIDF